MKNNKISNVANERVKKNLKALKLLQEDNLNIKDDEKRTILNEYTGWGGLDAGAGGAGGGADWHVQRAGRCKHAVGVRDDGAGARDGLDEGAGGAGGGAGGHVQRAGRGKLVVGGLCIFPSFRPWSRMGAYSGAATGVPG